MKIEDAYLKLTHDISGSRSKNRFRVELLWGICKMLDLMESGNDFTVVFDYVCDIEFHFMDGFEFYQIKTHDSSQGVCKYETLTQRVEKPRKRRSGSKKTSSILGRLYAIKVADGKAIKKLVIVSNVALKDGEKVWQTELSCLNDLSNKVKCDLSKAMSSELGLQSVDLSNVYYLYSHMDLKNPELAVKGRLITSFEKIKGEEPQNPNALWRMIFDEVKERACFEYPQHEYGQLLAKKGLTRKDIDDMLESHAQSSKTGVETARRYIDRVDNLFYRRVLRQALSKVVPLLARSRALKEAEKCMLDELSSMPHQDGSIDVVVGHLLESCGKMIPLEYSEDERKALAILVVSRFEEGGC